MLKSSQYGQPRPDGSILLTDLHRDYQRIRQTAPQRLFLERNGLQHTNSSCISAAGARDDTLIIRFHSGSVYEYPGLANHLDKLLAANSRGKYFNRHIRKTKNYSKVGTLPFPSNMETANIPKLTDQEVFDSLNKQPLKDIIRAYPDAKVSKKVLINSLNFDELMLNLLKVYLIS